MRKRERVEKVEAESDTGVTYLCMDCMAILHGNEYHTCDEVVTPIVQDGAIRKAASYVVR